MPTYEYYELRGLDPQGKMPSGMLRVVKSEDGLWYEKIMLDGKWVVDNELVRYFAGYADDAEKISKEKADEFVAYLRSGQAAIDKVKGEWK